MNIQYSKLLSLCCFIHKVDKYCWKISVSTMYTKDKMKLMKLLNKCINYLYSLIYAVSEGSRHQDKAIVNLLNYNII